MQIERFNHLQFPSDRRVSASAEDAARSAAQEAVSTPVASLTTVAPAAQARERSAVLRLGANADVPALYTRLQKSGAVQDADADWDRMAQQHQDALTRQGQEIRTLGVSKDGILVAKPRTAFSAQESDFVALAVSAMRDFRDTADRAKAAQAGDASVQTEAPSGLRSGLAHLAARFKAFA